MEELQDLRVGYWCPESGGCEEGFVVVGLECGKQVLRGVCFEGGEDRWCLGEEHHSAAGALFSLVALVVKG